MKKKFALSLSAFYVIFLGTLYFSGRKSVVLDVLVIIVLAIECLTLAYTLFFRKEEEQPEEPNRVKRDQRGNPVVQKEVTCVAEGKDEEITVNVRVIVSRRNGNEKDECISEVTYLPDSDRAGMSGVAKAKEVLDVVPDKNDEKKRNSQKSKVSPILLNPTRDTLEDWNVENFVFTSLNNGVQRFKLIDGKYVYPKDEYVGKKIIDMKQDLNRQKIAKIFEFPNDEKNRCIIRDIVPAEVKKLNQYEYELIRFGKIEVDEESGY